MAPYIGPLIDPAVLAGVLLIYVGVPVALVVGVAKWIWGE